MEIYILIKIIKYICKYIYKGRDKTTLKIININEIRRYLICRYINFSQIIWNLLKFLIYKKYLDIIRLTLYFLYKQTIIFPIEIEIPNL
jgi:hypothetical protein